MRPEQLVDAAIQARARAYAPYSDYAVGAALLDVDGRVHLGVNVENASYGLSCCAERSAVFAAVSAGVRRFVALAVVTADGAMACGACRQVLREFAPELVLHLADASGAFRTARLSEMLPDSFGPGKLGRPEPEPPARPQC
jgi:cytidine deaminase